MTNRLTTGNVSREKLRDLRIIIRRLQTAVDIAESIEEFDVAARASHAADLAKQVQVKAAHNFQTHREASLLGKRKRKAKR